MTFDSGGLVKEEGQMERALQGGFPGREPLRWSRRPVES